jgi:hypothetical protein
MYNMQNACILQYPMQVLNICYCIYTGWKINSQLAGMVNVQKEFHGFLAVTYKQYTREIPGPPSGYQFSI